jgi:hypothetical protein
MDTLILTRSHSWTSWNNQSVCVRMCERDIYSNVQLSVTIQHKRMWTSATKIIKKRKKKLLSLETCLRKCHFKKSLSIVLSDILYLFLNFALIFTPRVQDNWSHLIIIQEVLYLVE